MQISIGMALVRGAGALISYLLRDEFITNRAAGAVNGTAAEPGPGLRNASSANTVISSGELVQTGTGTWTDTYLYYAAGWGRQPGLILKNKAKVSASPVAMFGFRTDQNSSQVGFNNTGLYALLLNLTPRRTSDGTSPTIRVLTADTYYNFYTVLRAAGKFVFTNTGTYPLLDWIDDWSSAATLYAGASVFLSAHTLTNDYFRMPTPLWLPTPLASDGFASAFGTTDGLGHAETSGIGSGGSGVTWTGATWSVSAAKAVNTPGVGSELVVNGDFAVDANWSKGTGWTIAAGVANHVAGATSFLTQAILVAESWYRCDWTIANYSGSGLIQAEFGITSNLGEGRGANGSYVDTKRATGTQAGIRGPSTSGFDVDNVSFKLLTLADLFSSVSVSTADVLADVNVVVTAGTQAGLVLNLDSTSSPANFVIAYHDGTNCKLEKCVAGVYTTVVTAAATYSAGATLRVTKIGTAYRLYWNNALVGSGTISDAGIISNLKHGLFSTYSQNTLDNFVLYASGSEGQYAILDSY